MSRVLLTKVEKRFGDVVALKSLELEVTEGEFLTLLGPSGCGKTTTLRMIAGFEQPSSGTILLGDEDVTMVAPQHREIGMVFQDYALFPHMTIEDNIAFGLKERGYEKSKIDTRVKELLELIRLPQVHDRYPSEVSGGQQQRIAVARAVAYPPRVLLMDEPLGALDLKLREVMQTELRRIQQELGITTVYVTHDQTEAMNMSDRIVVMNEGEIEQMGGAEEIYNKPKSSFVANFVGQVNLLPGTLGDVVNGECKIDTKAGSFVTPMSGSGETGQDVVLAIRPELLRLLNSADAVSEGTNNVKGVVKGKSFAGNLMKVTVEVADDLELTVEHSPRQHQNNIGDQVSVSWSKEDGIALLR